jgi:hypothetical protein
MPNTITEEAVALSYTDIASIFFKIFEESLLDFLHQLTFRDIGKLYVIGVSIYIAISEGIISDTSFSATLLNGFFGASFGVFLIELSNKLGQAFSERRLNSKIKKMDNSINHEIECLHAAGSSIDPFLTNSLIKQIYLFLNDNMAYAILEQGETTPHRDPDTLMSLILEQLQLANHLLGTATEKKGKNVILNELYQYWSQSMEDLQNSLFSPSDEYRTATP